MNLRREMLKNIFIGGILFAGATVSAQAILLYGTEIGNSGNIYLVDTIKQSQTKVGTTTPIASGNLNGNAMNAKSWFYFATYNGSAPNSASNLYYNDLISGTETFAGALIGHVADAAIYNNFYWYIDNATDDLRKVTLNSNGLVVSDDKVADITGNTNTLSFGDIAFDNNGILFGSTGKIFFTYDINNDIFKKMDSVGFSVQLAFGDDGILYGQDASNGNVYSINPLTNDRTFLFTIPSGIKLADLATVPKAKVNCTTLEPAFVTLLYGVHDEGLNNTQFFTVSSETFEVKALGEMKKAHDIEALDIHPQTAELFAASGKEAKKPGYLYHVDKNSGQLTDIGSTGFKEIDGLSFHSDGTLWGWATGDGLVTINTATGQANLEVPYLGEVEDLTWNTSGTILFGVENMQNNPDAGVQLLAYDGNKLTTVCKELTRSLEIEALDTLPDDTLLFGKHGKNSLPLGVIDVTNCQIVTEQEISTNYNDVEGIAWPSCQ